MPHNKYFTDDEIEFIKDNYHSMTVDEIADNLQRTPKAIRGKIERLGLSLSKLPRNKPYTWSEDELQILRDNHSLPDHLIKELLPRFSLAQITRKRLALGFRKHNYEPYIQSNYYQTFRNGQRIWIHKEVAEQKIGRKLHKDEVVHHINGDKLDNRPENLFVCSDKKHHGNIHSQLEQIAFELIKKDIIKFNPQTGTYYISE